MNTKLKLNAKQARMIRKTKFARLEEKRNLRAKDSKQALKIASHQFQSYGLEKDEPEGSSQELFSGFFMGFSSDYQFR